MSTPALGQAELLRLAKYDTPTICNVIELFAVRPRTAGYMDARIRSCFPEMPPAVGYAATATIRTAFAPAQGSIYASLEEQVRRFAELPGPALVVFQDLDDPSVAATFGEIMCSAYQAFGAVGLVTSGTGRDLEQVRALSFPVFTNGTICSHGYSHIETIHGPVRVGGLTVNPGDLLHGDANGVTKIPAGIASEVADAAAEYVAAESVVIECAKSGQADYELFADARRETLRLIEVLAKRLRRG
jgi:4-hydroxy-4-methyl-2-oxoglutarate aldolase